MIGQKHRLEKLYASHFKRKIDTLDFIDELDNMIEGKDIKECELVFIREQLYKTLRK